MSQLLTEMDGIEGLRGVLVLAATNRIDMLDAALLRAGRFDFLLELPAPDEKTRLEILKIHTREKPLGKDVDLGGVAKDADGMVGADIEAICTEASMHAIREFLSPPMAGREGAASRESRPSGTDNAGQTVPTSRDTDYSSFKIGQKHFRKAWGNYSATKARKR
jgi:transitional endoplasmic reticulum ATPase